MAAAAASSNQNKWRRHGNERSPERFNVSPMRFFRRQTSEMKSSVMSAYTKRMFTIDSDRWRLVSLGESSHYVMCCIIRILGWLNQLLLNNIGFIYLV